MQSWLLFHCWPCMGCLPRLKLFHSMHALVNWRIKAFESLIEILKMVSMNSRPWRVGRSGISKQISPARFFSSVLTTNWHRYLFKIYSSSLYKKITPKTSDITRLWGELGAELSPGAYYLMYSFRTPLRLGCLSLRNALASIWRIRSRVTSKICPISSKVFMRPSSRP